MSEDYFDDASDADFLALAQQLDSRGNRSTTGSAISGSGTVRPAASTTTAPRPGGSTGTSGTTRPEPSKQNQSAPRVQRPGFNAIIVNTRQVGRFSIEG
jgi:hypothetical protein